MGDFYGNPKACSDNFGREREMGEEAWDAKELRAYPRGKKCRNHLPDSVGHGD